jgi:hypothetical protein
MDRRRLVPTHEAQEIIQLVKELVSPEISKDRRLRSIIKSFDVVFGEDSDGKPAIWIYFVVDKDVKPSSEEVALLNDLAKTTTRGLLDRQVDGWPYVTFTDLPAESRGSSSRPT